MNRAKTATLGLALLLVLVVAPSVLAQVGEPGDPAPEVPLHIEDLLCPLSPRGPQGCITQGFGAHHRGIDISLWGGTPVSATHSGTAACAGWVGGHFGNLVIVRSAGDGSTERSPERSRRRLAEVPPEWESWYGHLDQVFVQWGEEVARGQLIGLSGNTGEQTTGAHLHYELRHYGVPVDPMELPRQEPEGLPTATPDETAPLLDAQEGIPPTPVLPLDLDEERDRGADESGVASLTTAPISGSVAVAVLIAGLALSALTSLTQTLAIRSLERTYRRQKTQELELAIAQSLAAHQEQVRDRLATDPDAWREVIGQLLTDAGADGDAVLTGVSEVSTTPCPHFAVTGANGQLRYLFTTDPRLLRKRPVVRRRERVVPLDVGLSPFARVEVQALWNHLAQGQVHGKPSALPRDAAWWLVVQKLTDQVPEAKKRWRWNWRRKGSHGR